MTEVTISPTTVEAVADALGYQDIQKFKDDVEDAGGYVPESGVYTIEGTLVILALMLATRDGAE